LREKAEKPKKELIRGEEVGLGSIAASKKGRDPPYGRKVPGYGDQTVKKGLKILGMGKKGY